MMIKYNKKDVFIGLCFFGVFVGFLDKKENGHFLREWVTPGLFDLQLMTNHGLYGNEVTVYLMIF